MSKTNFDKVQLEGDELTFKGTTYNTILKATVGAAQETTVTIPDPSSATASVVLNAGASTIAGVKTFSSVPILPLGGYTQTVTTPANNSTVKIANAIGQATVFTIPDPGSATADVVLNKSAQSIAGVKTFTSQPIFKAGVTAADGVRFDGATNDAVVVAADHAAERIYTLPDVGAAANFCMLKASQTTAGELKRADLTEEALVEHRLCLATDVKEIDGTCLTASAAAGKFGLTQGGSFASPSGVVLLAESCTSATKTDWAVGYSKVPNAFIAGQSLSLEITVAMTGAGAAAAAPNSTIDAKVYRLTAAGAIGTDLCTTAAQAFAASATTRVFALDNTAVVPGDILVIWIEAVVIEAAGNAAVGEIDMIAVKYDIKG